MMMTQGIPFEPPNTETSALVRPVVSQKLMERAAISSDPELELALEFVDALRSDVGAEVVEQARVVLTRVRTALRTIDIPTIASSPAGLIGMTWENSGHHCNVQIHHDRRIEFFGEDLATGELWSYETPWSTNSNELIERLNRVA